MNFAELQNELFGVFRLPAVDSRRRQVVRSAINQAIRQIVAKKSNWSFLYKKATFNSTAADTEYALPADFSTLIAVHYDGTKCEMFNPLNTDRYKDITGSEQLCCTIRRLTSTPRYNVGYVFPTANSDTINGSGTAFDTSVVGSFFKTSRDGELYRIKAFNSATQITLDQKYMGRSLAGTVTVLAASPTVVIGNPYTTNFRTDMIGKLIAIGGTNYTISAVDVDKQELIVTSNITTTGAMLSYSIQDTYEIDPAGQYVLEFFPAIPEDDKDIEIEYYAFQTPLTGDYDVSLIPSKYDNAIIYGSAIIYGAMDGSELFDRDAYVAMYQDALQTMANTDDPLDMAFDISSEPDIVRLQETSIVR